MLKYRSFLRHNRFFYVDGRRNLQSQDDSIAGATIHAESAPSDGNDNLGTEATIAQDVIDADARNLTTQSFDKALYQIVGERPP
jgi:hypothetical protein